MSGTTWHLLQAGIIGLVQGLTEFIPISSSGHLVITRELLHIEDPGNFFDAVLHLATLFAVVIYFWRDWLQMIKLEKDKLTAKTALAVDRRMLTLLFISTLPALIVGFFIQRWVEDNFRSLIIVAILLLAVGILFIVSRYLLKPVKYNRALTTWDAVNIGLAQAVAILPGISRSGLTILGGMYVGLTREAAVKFSFLMAAPVMLVVGVYSLYQSILDRSIGQDLWSWLIAFVVALLSGWLTIRWLIGLFRKYSLDIFGIYLVIVGIGLIVYHFLK